ncbi:MAG: hypothetical protein JWN04_211 [Myxococcaceae bacterium]|nr:hypothetical protein [Myxococcaceae bacterium]
MWRPRLQLASILWLAAIAIPVSLLFLGRLHAIPYGEYIAAGQRLLLHQPLYDLSNIDGFQYLPQSAFLFAPLAALGSPWGDVLWRALGWTAYAFGIRRLCAQLLPLRSDSAFLLSTALAIGPAFTNLINGQANLLIAALALHATGEMTHRRWWRATACLAFGLCIKPLMAVPLLLAFALYTPMRWRLALGLTIAFAAPWLFVEHAYVLAQYRDCAAKLRLCADPDRLFEDLRGLLATAGLVLSPSVYLVTRVAAAAGVLLLSWSAQKRLSQTRSAFIACALALSYLMLFNPRTLTSSYVMPGGCAALLGAQYLLQRRVGAALVTLAVILAWSINHHVVPWVEYWLRPLACLAFFGVLTREAFGDGSEPGLLLDRPASSPTRAAKAWRFIL